MMGFVGKLFMGVLGKMIGTLAFIAVVFLITYLIMVRWLTTSTATWLLVAISISVLIVLVLLIRAWIAWRRKKAIERQLDQVNPVADPLPAVEQDIGMDGRFHRAVAAMRRGRRRDLVHRRGWFLVLGPGGSGKTALLQGAGLECPNLGLDDDQHGPTRDVALWPSEQGVFIDTAGALATDREERRRFGRLLDLVRRVHGPVDGVVLVFDLAAVMSAGEEEAAALARQARERLEDLVQALGVVVPVHLIFNKSDLLRGFCEYFAHLDKNDRSRDLGFSLPYESREVSAVVRDVALRFDHLYDALRTHRIDSLASEHEGAAREAALLFPSQFVSIKERLCALVAELVKRGPFQEGPILRSCHFTSADQVGVPVDLVVGAHDPELAGSAAVEPLRPAERCPYFVYDAVQHGPIGDAELAYPTAHRARRARRASRIAVAASVFLGLGLLTALVVSFRSNANALVELENELRRYPREHDGIDTVTVRLARLEPLRTRLQKLEAHRRDGVPWPQAWGLYTGDDAGAALRAAWYRLTEASILRPAVDRLATVLAENLAAYQGSGRNGLSYYERLYDRYLAFAMLTGELDCDPSLLDRVLRGGDGAPELWLEGIFGVGASIADEDRSRALAHLDYVLSQADRQAEWQQGAWSTAQHGALGERVAQRLRSRDAWTNLVYSKIVNEARASVDSSSYAAPLTPILLPSQRQRALFTYDPAPIQLYSQVAYDEYVAPQIEREAERLAGVFTHLGGPSRPGADELAERFTEHYAHAWQEEWYKALEGLRIEGAATLDQAILVLDRLAAADGPYHALLEAIARNQVLELGTIDHRNQPTFRPGGEDGWLAKACSHIATFTQALRSYDENAGRDRRLDHLEELQTLAEATTSASQALTGELGAIADPRARDAIGDHLRAILRVGTGAVRAELSAQANRRWRERVLAVYQDSLAARFPFADAEDSVPIATFNTFFDPQEGVIALLAAELAPYQAVTLLGEPALRARPAYHAYRERARRLHALFHAEEGDGPAGMPFTVFFHQRRGVEDMRLTVGNARGELYHDPDLRADLHWDLAGRDRARLAVRVDNELWLGETVTNDPWSLLRLVRRGAVEPIDTTSTRVVWDLALERPLSERDDATGPASEPPSAPATESDDGKPTAVSATADPDPDPVTVETAVAEDVRPAWTVSAETPKQRQAAEPDPAPVAEPAPEPVAPPAAEVPRWTAEVVLRTRTGDHLFHPSYFTAFQPPEQVF